MTTFPQLKDEKARERGFTDFSQLSLRYAEDRLMYRMEVLLSDLAEKYALIRIREAAIEALPPQQRRLFDALTGEWMRTSDICKKSGTVSGKVDAPLMQLVNRGLAEYRVHGPKLKYWRLREA